MMARIGCWNGRAMRQVGCLIVGVALAVVGCSDEPAPDAGTDTSAPEDVDGGGVDEDIGDNTSLIEDMKAIPNPSNALSYYIEYTTTETQTTDLTVTCGDDWETTYTADQSATDHRVFVMGLWAGASCELTASATADDGKQATQSIAVDVGQVPDFLPDLEVNQRTGEKMQSGWTMFNLTNPFDNVPVTVAMVDHQGRYRWYHQLPTSNPGADTEVHPTGDSIFVGGNRGNMAAYEINWEGKTLWKNGFPMHHEIRRAGDGSDDLLVLRHVDQCEQEQRSDGVFRFSRDQSQFTESWVLCDYWFPPADANPGDDWSHLNAIESVPGEEAWILSSRTQHSLFKFDYGNDQVDWRMGLRGEFGLENDELFYRQHAPEIQANGNILLFDNGSHPDGHDRTWSRALEIAYDTDTMEAEIAWQYKPDPEIFTPIWGDADRLDNGNTLITFGMRNKDDERNSRLLEVTSDKTRVWDLEVTNKWGWYRSDRIVEPPTGYVKTGE